MDEPESTTPTPTPTPSQITELAQGITTAYDRPAPTQLDLPDDLTTTPDDATTLDDLMAQMKAL